jgi:hypothetical protein
MGGTSAAFSGSEADNGGTTDDPDYRTVLVTRRFTRSGLAAGRSFLTLRADTAAGHHLDTIRSLWSALLLWGCLSFFWGDAAMWNFRFAAHHVVSVFFCLICISGAHAQTAAEATGDKRVQVLEIRDPSAPGESLVNKPKAASKKKVAKRKSHGEVKAAASEGAPKIPVQSTMASVAPANPVGNDALPPSTEQTGTLTFASTSSPGMDNTAGPSGEDSVTANEHLSASGPVSGNSPRSTPDVPAVHAVRQVPSSRNTPLAQSMAMLGGATLAAMLGWFLVGSSRRRLSVENF